MVDVVSYLNTGLGVNPAQQSEASQEMGKDAFMQLLITQMSYQNPLEPMDNTEFAGQLAQFSSLEQMQNIASGMEVLALSQTASTNSQMVNLLGKRVIVPGSELTVDGEKPLELQYDMMDEPVSAKLYIKNSDGELVREMHLTDMAVGTNSVTFDGKDNDGNFLEAGTYTYEILSMTGEAIDGITAYSNYLVDAVQYSGAEIMFSSGSANIDLGDISKVIQN